jgi:hypothetical protein
MDDELKRLRAEFEIVRMEHSVTQSLLLAFLRTHIDSNQLNPDLIGRSFDLASETFTAASYDISNREFAQHATRCLDTIERVRESLLSHNRP